jgi:hypothetical protein
VSGAGAQNVEAHFKLESSICKAPNKRDQWIAQSLLGNLKDFSIHPQNHKGFKPEGSKVKNIAYPIDDIEKVFIKNSEAEKGTFSSTW